MTMENHLSLMNYNISDKSQSNITTYSERPSEVIHNPQSTKNSGSTRLEDGQDLLLNFEINLVMMKKRPFNLN